jgi:hypothetical protein
MRATKNELDKRSKHLSSLLSPALCIQLAKVLRGTVVHLPIGFYLTAKPWGCWTFQHCVLRAEVIAA